MSAGLAVSAAFVAVALFLRGLVIAACGGEYVYPIDDTYIHIAMAKCLAFDGTWGVEAGKTAFCSSSPLWTLLLAGLYRLFGVSETLPWFLTFGIDADYVLTGMSWFALAIAPMLGLANFGYHAHADRFTYIPSVGLALLLAYGLMVSVRRFGTAVASLTMACVLSALAALTWWQTGFWQDDAKLFTRTVEIDGDRNVVAHRNLGMYYFELTHELEKTCRHFDLAEKANMQVVLSLVYVLMMALEELGKNEEMDALMRRIDAVRARQQDLVGQSWYNMHHEAFAET